MDIQRMGIGGSVVIAEHTVKTPNSMHFIHVSLHSTTSLLSIRTNVHLKSFDDMAMTSTPSFDLTPIIFCMSVSCAFVERSFSKSINVFIRWYISSLVAHIFYSSRLHFPIFGQVGTDHDIVFFFIFE